MRVLLALACIAAAAAHAQAPAIRDVFRLPQYAAMQISPDGQRIAALVPVNGRQNIAIIQVSPRSANALSTMATRDIVEVLWLSDKRLLYRTGSLGVRADDAKGGGLFAVDVDGRELRMLGEGIDEMSTAGLRISTYRHLQLVRRLPNSEDIIAQEHVFERDRNYSGGLFRVNTRTARRELLSMGAPDSGTYESWVVDARGVPRVMIANSGGRTRIHYRAGPDAPWTKLHEHSQHVPSWAPVAVAEDDKTLIVSAAQDGDRSVLRQYDPAAKVMGEVLAAHPQVDLRGVITEDGKILGTSYDADRPGVAWFDPVLARIQRNLDAAYPDAVNQLSWSRDRSRVVVTTSSDVSPGAFHLYDVKAGKLEWLADRAPWIDPAKMSPMRPVRYAARDGLQVPAYLTVPRGKEKNLPLVVLVHGGPWVDGQSWEYDPEAQFLASRGYAVLAPNFRGTTRYGWKHFAASFGQWGLAMQDDLEDGVRWAVKEGIADPKRVCIYGASYGGYAAMMGLARTPGVYRCGINYVGVTDLDLFLDATWSDFAYSDFIAHSAKEMMGERAKWKENSPVTLAARIESPVLMAYGAADRRVIPEHGTRMRDALERLGRKPQWMLVDGEGHGFRDPKNVDAFYGAMEKFLQEHIGTPR